MTTFLTFVKWVAVFILIAIIVRFIDKKRK